MCVPLIIHEHTLTGERKLKCKLKEKQKTKSRLVRYVIVETLVRKRVMIQALREHTRKYLSVSSYFYSVNWVCTCTARVQERVMVIREVSLYDTISQFLASSCRMRG